LKLVKQPISLVLLAVLLFSLLPYNALHVHEEEEHFEASLNNSSAAHHCELDDVFCQEGLKNNCEHKQHLNNPIPDCFTCQFHFVKHYEPATFTSVGLTLFKDEIRCVIQIFNSTPRLTLPFNKGPPKNYLPALA
jgi:hypothetical protein